MDVDTNVNTEMSDLVHRAEEWAALDGFNKVPEVSLNELRSHRIGNQILTRAAFLLMEQMGIKTVEDYKKHFGEVVREEKEHERETPISPMAVEEFQSILKNGWHFEEPLPNSPFGSRRRTSMLADLIPLSPIVSEASSVSPKKFAMPNRPARHVEPHQSSRRMFTSTPKQKITARRTNSMGGTPINQEMRKEIMTPQRATSTPRMVRQQTPAPAEGETPMENRASRLRRLKLQETRRSLGGNERLDSSMNSSFGWK